MSQSENPSETTSPDPAGQIASGMKRLAAEITFLERSIIELVEQRATARETLEPETQVRLAAKQFQRPDADGEFQSARAFLADLPDRERGALSGYCKGLPAGLIEAALHLPSGRLARFRMELRKRVLEDLAADAADGQSHARIGWL